MRVFANDIRNFRLHASLLFNTRHRYSSICFGSARPVLPCSSGFKTSQVLCRSRVFSAKADNSNNSQYNIAHLRKPFGGLGAFNTHLGPTPAQIGSKVLPNAFININESERMNVHKELQPFNDPFALSTCLAMEETSKYSISSWGNIRLPSLDNHETRMASYPCTDLQKDCSNDVDFRQDKARESSTVSAKSKLNNKRAQAELEVESGSINLKLQKCEILIGKFIPVATESYLAKDGDKESPCKEEKPKGNPMPCRKIKGPCRKHPPPSPTSCKYEKKENPCKKKSPCKEDPCDDPCKKAQQTPVTIQEPSDTAVQEPGMRINAMLLAKKNNGDCKKDDKKKKDPCQKKDDKKQDPCKKKDDKKKDPCKKDDKKQDPCKKKDDKKQDPCKKDDKKKKDPCKKDDKKQDPCKKKDDKKDDPCKKKDDKKDDPCKKKKDDPCKKKKDDPCKKKDDKKDGPCKKDDKKKGDPCKKKEDKKKGDPCKKKDDKKKGESCKKDDKKNDDKKKLEEDCEKLEQEKACEKKNLEEACKKLKQEKQKEDPTRTAACNTADPCSNMKQTCDSDPAKGKEKKDEKKKPKKKCDANQSEPKGETSSSDYFGTKSTRPNMGVSVSMSRHIREPANDIQILATSSGKAEVAMTRRKTMPLFRTRLDTVKTPRFPLDLLSITKRKYSTKKPEDEDEEVPHFMCKKISRPKKRKDIKKRTEPQEDCGEAVEEAVEEELCGKKKKKELKEGECPEEEVVIVTKDSCPDDKENKNSSIGNLSAWYGIPYRWVCPAPNTTRPLSTSATNKSKNSKSECDEEPFNIDDICRNEVLQITDACKIEKCYEPIPRFSDYDVVLRNHAVAISGSDIHVYETGGEGCPGMTMGHDAACEVVKVGRCIHTLKPGDRVAVESGLSCGICTFCKHGSYNMCSQLLYNGFLSKYQVHPADLCHKLPPSISYEEGALTHSLALGCQACFKARITPVSNVLIIGSCITAVSAALCARAFGAKKVCMTCSMKPLLQWINKCFGFDYVPFEVTYELNETLENVYCSFMDWPDIAINCSISETSMNLAVMALQPCGTCVLAECDTECACFNAMDILMKNLKLLPSFRSTNMFPTAIHLIKSGKAPMQRLISECYSWNQVDRAFQEAQHEANVGNRKIIIRCSEEENIEQCSDA